MAKDTKEQLVQTIWDSPCFGIQLDETTDVAGLAQLIVLFVVYLIMKCLKIFYFVKSLEIFPHYQFRTETNPVHEWIVQYLVNGFNLSSTRK